MDQQSKMNRNYEIQRQRSPDKMDSPRQHSPLPSPMRVMSSAEWKLEDASLDKMLLETLDGQRRFYNEEKSRSNGDCDHMDAVQEAQLQASFCEQTAREMEQVLNWWCHHAQTTHEESQSLSLKENSLVMASRQNSMDEDCPFSTLYNQDEPHESHLFKSLFLTSNRTKDPFDTFPSPFYDTLYTTPQQHQEALEQSIVVDDICLQAQHMKKLLVELQDASVDNNGNAYSVEDLSLWNRLFLFLHMFRHRLAIILQQWLYHSLPPSILSLWLSPKPQFLITWVLLPIVLFIILCMLLLFFVSTSSRNEVSKLGTVVVVLPTQEQNDDDEDFCEFMQQKLM
jgi:hypothetical protein